MDDALVYLSDVDSHIRELIEQYPRPSFLPHKNYYQELASSIISQQLSVKAAATIEGRFKDLFGGDFPSPDQILTKDIEELRSVGLSRPKAGYIQDLAKKVLDGTVDFSTIDSLSNQEIIDELTKVKGIGEWTVHMFMMFCVGRPDVLPIGDLGIKNGMHALYHLDEKPTPEEMTALAEKNHWHPYETVASWYIWHSLDNKPAIS